MFRPEHIAEKSTSKKTTVIITSTFYPSRVFHGYQTEENLLQLEKDMIASFESDISCEPAFTQELFLGDFARVLGGSAANGYSVERAGRHGRVPYAATLCGGLVQMDGGRPPLLGMAALTWETGTTSQLVYRRCGSAPWQVVITLRSDMSACEFTQNRTARARELLGRTIFTRGYAQEFADEFPRLFSGRK
jgi:hypothetical protein